MFVVRRGLRLTWGAVIVWIENVASDPIASDCARFVSHGQGPCRDQLQAGEHLCFRALPKGFGEPRHRAEPPVAHGEGPGPQTLKSEEAVLAAVDSGAVTLEPTRVVLNCPIVHRGPKGALPGVSLVHPVR